MECKAVIFDLDGTLADTLEDLKNSVNFALGQFGFAERTLDEVRSFVGNGVRRLMYLSVPENTPDGVTESCLAAFRRHYAANSLVATKPYDGIMKMLETLKEKGIPAAVVSNKMQTAAVDIVNSLFGALIAVTVGQVDGIPSKPAPDGVLNALEHLGAAPANAVYVGDSEVDCMTAHNAGMPCIGVAWGFRGRGVLKQNDADFIIDAPMQLFGCIGLSEGA